MRGKGLKYLLVLSLLIFIGLGGLWLWRHALESKTPILISAPLPTLTTLYQKKDVYQTVFENAAKEIEPKDNVAALITSHHFLASPLIARTYRAGESDSIRRVILLSPDHFQNIFSSGTLAFSTQRTWDALFGTIQPDAAFIQRLLVGAKTVANDNPFLTEHGIYTEIPFIQHAFPRATIVPLIVKNTSTYEEFKGFGKELAKMSEDEKTILVVSSDFSHHATVQSAKKDDAQMVIALQNLSGADLSTFQNDCRACLAILDGYLSEIPTRPTFHLIENKNSTDFGGKDEDVTSYVSAYYSTDSKVQPEARGSGQSVSVLFGGDMQFDRYIRTVISARGEDFVFGSLKPLLQSVDLVVANLEGPISDNPSVSLASKEGERDNYVFTFPPESAVFLRDAHIKLVNLGNNHILNFKEDGVQQTKQYLSQAGVQFFGSPLLGDIRTSLQTFGSIKVAFVNYNEFISQGKEKALADIASVRDKADFVILYTHWGKEYVEATDSVKNLAHEFIDAGVDLIIGSHPHVVQAKEEYRGKMIYYSLGNFIFDQYFRPETRAGLLVKVMLDPVTKSIQTDELPITLSSTGQTGLLSAKK